MRIYLAGLYATCRGAVATNSANLQVTAELAYPWILESFHYIGGEKFPRIIREKGDSIFLDSGAFSMHTQGVSVDLQRYADFIHKNKDIIHIASNLDHIGAGGEAQTYHNQKALEDMGVEICPVFHARDDDSWLAKYLEEGYPYIFLGGMVPENTAYLKAWLDRIWDKYLCDSEGKARVKVHGFGMTTLELMFRYPWFSVDSTSWVMASRMGVIYLDLPHKDVKLCISDRSPRMKDFDAHLDTLSPVARKIVLSRIEELGYDPGLLRTMYGWRDHFNIEYFRRIQERRVDTFNRELMVRGLFDA